MLCFLTLQMNLSCRVVLNAPLAAGWTVPTVSPSPTNPASKFIRYDLHRWWESDCNSHESLSWGWKTQACSPSTFLKAAKFWSHGPWPSPAPCFLQHEARGKLKSVGWHMSDSGTDGKRFSSVIYEARLCLLLKFYHLESLLSPSSDKGS